MGVQVKLGALNVAGVTHSFVNIGPTLKTAIRVHGQQNAGMGAVIGDGNRVEALSVVHDEDIVDLPYKKIVVQNG